MSDLSSAVRLANLVAALLSDASSEPRRRAGAKVLLNLAVLARTQLQLTLATPTPENAVDGETVVPERGGAADALKQAVFLAKIFPVCGGSTNAGGGGGGDAAVGVGKGDNHDGGVAAVGDWVLQALGPLLRYAEKTYKIDQLEGERVMEMDTAHSSGSGGGGIGVVRNVTANPSSVVAAANANPSASAVKNAGDATTRSITSATTSAANIDNGATATRELWVALTVADALVQAARYPDAEDSDTASVDGAVAGDAPRGPLSAVLFGTPLAAGLLALARSPTLADADADAEHSTVTPAVDVKRETLATTPDGMVTGDGPADAALVIVKEAAALCPEGVWTGLRAELLPALTAVGGVSDGDGGGGGQEGGGERRRGAQMLRDVVNGMGTGVVPFAARLLPVALRGMTDADDEVSTYPGVSYVCSIRNSDTVVLHLVPLLGSCILVHFWSYYMEQCYNMSKY